MSAAEGREGPLRGAALVSFGTRGVRCQRPEAKTGRGSTRGLCSLQQDSALLAQRLRPTSTVATTHTRRASASSLGARKTFLHTRTVVRLSSEA